MTFAPELENAEKLVELLLEYGVKPSMGHSVANEVQTLRAIDAGASYCTHLFNGMPPLHQREMGLSSIALTDDRVTVELIIDGRHIHPRMVDLACRCKTSSKLVGISDCTMAAGMPNGEYRDRAVDDPGQRRLFADRSGDSGRNHDDAGHRPGIR